ncbi:MAG: SCO family protein [Myxococcota bacterium]
MAVPPPDFEPPPWLQFLRRHIWVIMGVLSIVTITAIRPYMRHIPDPPAVMFTLPEYDLVDHEERSFTPSTLEGQVWIASFVFTRCPSSCPAVTRAMNDLHDRFARNGIGVKMVSFSVDPENDTPAVLAAYHDDLGVDDDAWRFVTGELPAITTLLEDGFKLGIGERTETDGLFDIAHSTKLALVDAEGNVRGFYGLDPTPNVDGGLDELYERADRVVMLAKTGK